MFLQYNCNGLISGDIAASVCILSNGWKLSTYLPVNFIFRSLRAWNEGLTYCVCVLFFFNLVRLPSTLAVYPFDRPRRGRDISRSKNPSARIVGVKYGQGPDGRTDGSTVFYGRRTSYVEIPNTGRLDARYSITILIWVYHDGRLGPIVNYNPNGFGVHLWMTGRRQLFVRFMHRDGRRTRPLRSSRFKYRAWNYVGATYDERSGFATVWVNSNPVARRRLGRVRLSTNYPIRLGATRRSRSYFRGKLFCLQLYSVALTKKQIFEAKRKCFLPGKVARYYIQFNQTKEVRIRS